MAVEAAALQRLRRAHAWLEAGEHLRAAAAFDELAAGAQARRLPQGAWLMLQAGRAWLLAGRPDHSQPRFQEGLRLLEEQGDRDRAQLVAHQIIVELERRGLADQASSIASWRSGPGDRPMAARDIQLSLPAKCPYCGASVLPGEVDGYAEGQAMCAYCGSVISAHA
jgi:hypothetical protein